MNKSYKLDKFIFHPEIDQIKITKLFQIINKLDIYELQQYSLTHQIYLNVSNSEGECLIHEVIKLNSKIATQEAMINVIMYLYRNNVNPDKPDKYNKTPLHLACFYQYSKVIEYLLSINANPNYQDNFGQTPFHYIMLNNIRLCENNNKNNNVSNSSNCNLLNINLLDIKHKLLNFLSSNHDDIIQINIIKLTMTKMLNYDTTIIKKILTDYEEIADKIDKDSNNFNTLFNQSITHIDNFLNTKFQSFNLVNFFKLHNKTDNFYSWSPINNESFNLIINGDEKKYFKSSIDNELLNLKNIYRRCEIIDDEKFSTIKSEIISDIIMNNNKSIGCDYASSLIDFDKLTFINSMRYININFGTDINTIYSNNNIIDLFNDVNDRDNIAIIDTVTIFSTRIILIRSLIALKKIFIKYSLNNVMENISKYSKNYKLQIPPVVGHPGGRYVYIGDDYYIDYANPNIYNYYLKWIAIYPRHNKDKVKEWMFNMYCDLSTDDLVIGGTNLNCNIEYDILFIIASNDYNLTKSVKKNLSPYYIFRNNPIPIRNINDLFIILIKIILLLLYEGTNNLLALNLASDITQIIYILNNITDCNPDTKHLIEILIDYYSQLINPPTTIYIDRIIENIKTNFNNIQFENDIRNNIETCITKILITIYNSLNIKPYIQYIIDISYILKLYGDGDYAYNRAELIYIVTYIFTYNKTIYINDRDNCINYIRNILNTIKIPSMLGIKNIDKAKGIDIKSFFINEFKYCIASNFLGLNYLGSFYKYTRNDIIPAGPPNNIVPPPIIITYGWIPLRRIDNIGLYAPYTDVGMLHTDSHVFNSYHGYYLFLLKKISNFQIKYKNIIKDIIFYLEKNNIDTILNSNYYIDNFIIVINKYYELINYNLLINEYIELYNNAKTLNYVSTARKHIFDIPSVDTILKQLTNSINKIISTLYMFLKEKDVISNYYELDYKYTKLIELYHNPRMEMNILFTNPSIFFKNVFKNMKDLVYFSKQIFYEKAAVQINDIPQLFYNNIYEYWVYIIILPYVKKLINIIKDDQIFTDIDNFITNKVNIKNKNFMCYKILLNLLNTIITEKYNNIQRIQVIDYFITISNHTIENSEYKTIIQDLIYKYKQIKIKNDYINTDIITYTDKNYKNYNFHEIKPTKQQYILYSNNLNVIEKNNQRYYLSNEINLIKLLLKYNGLPLIKNIEGINIIGNIIKNYNIELLQELKNIDNRFIINDSNILNMLITDNLDNINKILSNIDNINITPINKILYNIDNCLYNNMANHINVYAGIENIIYLNQSLYINSYITLQYLSEHLLNVNKHFTYDDLKYLLNKMNINLDNVNLNYLNENLHTFNIPCKINSYIIPKIIEQETNKLENLKNDLRDINDIINLLTENNKDDLILIQTKQKVDIKSKIDKIETYINILKSNSLDKNILKAKHSINSKIIERYDDLNDIDKSLILESWKKLLKSDIKNNYNLIPLFLLKLQKDNIDLIQNNKTDKIEFAKILTAFKHLSILCESYFISPEYTDENKVLSFVEDLLIYLTKTIIGNSIENNIRVILFNYYITIYPNNKKNIDSIIDNILTSKIINYSYSILNILYDDLCKKLVKNICMIFANIDSKNNSQIDSEYELTSYFISTFNILDIRLPNELIIELQNIFTPTLNTMIKNIILLWRTNIENIFSFIINNYRCLKITDIIIN